jgi:NADPH:quinone reductase-like Zn-dependent oxidoreductase
MNAAVCDSYGDASVLKYKQIPIPTITSSTQILIKVKAAGVNPVDFKVRKGFLSPVLRLSFPIILGIDYSGEIVDPGQSSFKKGDVVYGKLQGIQGQGTYAEYVIVDTKVDAVYPKPEGWSFEQLCIGVILLTAYVGIVDHGRVTKDQRVLIVGGSGGVGSFAIQMAKSRGAHVTTICSKKNHDFVRGLGSDVCVDYHTELDRIQEMELFDFCFDCVGGDEYYELIGPRLQPKAVYSTAVGPAKYGGSEPMSFLTIGSMLGKLAWRNVFGSYKFVSSLPIPEFKFIDEMIRDGRIQPIPVVSFPLAEAQKAHEASESNRTVGKIVLVV